MWFAYFLNYCDRQAVTSMFPVLRVELGFTDKQLGLIASIFLWVYGAGSVIAGQIGDRISKRQLVVWSLVVWSVVTVATGFSTSVFMVLALRAGMGISESLYMPAAIALTANAHAPERRSRAIAALTTAQVAGIVGGGWFGGWMAHHGHWREAFLLLGAAGVLFAVPYHLFLRGVSEEAAAETRKTDSKLALAALAKVPTYRLLCVVFPAFVFGLWVIYTWFANFLHEKFSLNLADAGFNATAFLQGATLVGLLSGGVLADRLYLRTKAARCWLLTASLLLCAPCLHALGNSDTLAATRIAAAGFGLFAGLFMGNIFPASFEVVPANTRASAVGVLNLFGAIVSGFGAYLGGKWKTTIGIEGLMSLTALLYLAAAILLIAGIKLLFKRDYERIH